MSGICFGDVIVVNGPAYEVQVVPGFDPTGNPNDQSGLVQELPIIFDVEPNTPCYTALQEYVDNYAITNQGGPNYFSLIIQQGSGGGGTSSILESFRWDFEHFVPDSTYATMFDNILRFTFNQSKNPIGSETPRRSMNLILTGRANVVDDSYNPMTDKKVEINSVSGTYVGHFPAIEQQTEQDLTLVYDFNEAGGLFNEWVRFSVIDGTTSFSNSKRDLNVITFVPDSTVEDSRKTYYGCFPMKYEMFQGFSLDTTIKERVFVHCDSSSPEQPGGP